MAGRNESGGKTTGPAGPSTGGALGGTGTGPGLGGNAGIAGGAGGTGGLGGETDPGGGSDLSGGDLTGGDLTGADDDTGYLSGHEAEVGLSGLMGGDDSGYLSGEEADAMERPLPGDADRDTGADDMPNEEAGAGSRTRAKGIVQP